MIKSPCYGCAAGAHVGLPRGMPRGTAGWKTWSEGWREARAREAEANAVRKLTRSNLTAGTTVTARKKKNVRSGRKRRGIK